MKNNYNIIEYDNQVLSKSRLNKFCLVLSYLCLLLVGVANSNLLSAVLLLIILILFTKDEVYLLYPGLLVYYSYLYVPFTSLSLFRVYSLLMILKLLSSTLNIKVKSQIVQALVLIAYMLFSVIFINVRYAFFGIVDVIFAYLYVTEVLDGKKMLRKVMGVFAIACACSIVTGLVVGSGMDLSYQIGDSWRATNRFIGTFVDPNYCSQMYILGMIGIVSLSPFNKLVNTLLIMALVFGIAMTISFTGFIGLAIVVCFYMVLTKRITPKYMILFAILAVIMYGLYLYGTEYTDTPVLGDVAYRINSYILDYNSDASGSLAVSRISIYKQTIEKFEDQNIFKQIFGMNVVTPQLNVFNETVAHNDYVDMLYNCGLLLTIVFYVGIAYRLIKHIRLFRKSADQKDAFIASTKVIWLYYSFVLTMLSERTFYLCLFV